MSARKIFIITNRVPYPLKDGGNLAMNALIEGYREAGWIVYLLSMNTTRHFVDPGQLANLFRDIYKFEWLKVDNSLSPVRIIKNFLLSSEPEHAERFYKPEFEDKIKEIIRSFQPDVIQVESVFLTGYLPAIRQNSAALTVLRIHNVEFQIWQSLARKSRGLKKIYLDKLAKRIRNYERYAWSEFDLLLAITEKDANLIASLEDVREMVVAPFSVDTRLQVPAQQARWVGYHIGAMDWMPNREGMLWFLNKVWKRVHKAVPAFEFFFAGRNMPEELKKIQLPGVHCAGEVPDAAAFIADKKILIVPLFSSGGIRVKILEAMAAEKIVITTRAGIKGIEARSGEQFIQVSSPDDFARAIAWCLGHVADAERIGQRARQLVMEKYDNRVIMSNIIREIEILLASKA